MSDLARCLLCHAPDHDTDACTMPQRKHRQEPLEAFLIRRDRDDRRFDERHWQ